MTSEEFATVARTDPIVIVPVGALEEHGPHLPLGADMIQPLHVLDEVARRTGAFLAPSIPYGVCTTTRPYPGTVSVSVDSLKAFVRDVLDDFVRNGVRRVMVVSGHAGREHMMALRAAAQEVVDRKTGLKATVLSDYDLIYASQGILPEGDGHAGAGETSRILTANPDLVKGRAPAGKNGIPPYAVVDDPTKYWSGVTGDPAKASKALGQKLDDLVIDGLVELVEEVRRDCGRIQARAAPRIDGPGSRRGAPVRMALRRRRLGDARSDGRTSAEGRRHLSDGQRESHRGRTVPLPLFPREDGHPDHENPGRRGPRPLPQDGGHRPGRHRKGSSHAADRAEAYANVLSFLRFASIRSIFACSSRSMCAKISDHGTLRRYECTGRPLPSFLMSRLSTHRRRRSSCIAMLTSGWRSPVAFSISTDVVSSRFDRKTRVLAMFRERPVSMSRSTRVSSLRLRRTSLLVCISPPIINLTIYISSD